MHEFNVCQTIVETVEKQQKLLSPKQRLIGVNLVIGKLRSIVPDYLQFAYEQMTADTPLAGSKINVRVPALHGRCEVCKWEGELEKPRILCKACGGTRGEFLDGRELFLESLEVEDDE